MKYEAEFIEAVTAFPGCTIDRIAEINDISSPYANSQIMPLLAAGKIRREGGTWEVVEGHQVRLPFRYFLGDGKPVVMHRRTHKKKANGVYPTPSGWEAKYNELNERYVELEEWKANALRRYPDLAVADVVLRARVIVARIEPERKDAIMRGACDDKPIMLATIAALEENV